MSVRTLLMSFGLQVAEMGKLPAGERNSFCMSMMMRALRLFGQGLAMVSDCIRFFSVACGNCGMVEDRLYGMLGRWLWMLLKLVNSGASILKKMSKGLLVVIGDFAPSQIDLNSGLFI